MGFWDEDSDGTRWPTEPELRFQRYSNDKQLGGMAPGEDGAPVAQRSKNNSLAPQAFHNGTTDKTLAFEIEQSLGDLGKLLEE